MSVVTYVHFGRDMIIVIYVHSRHDMTLEFWIQIDWLSERLWTSNPRGRSLSSLSTGGHVCRVWVLGDAPWDLCPSDRDCDAKWQVQILRIERRLSF